jgi:hypothetical protein
VAGAGRAGKVDAMLSFSDKHHLTFRAGVRIKDLLHEVYKY